MANLDLILTLTAGLTVALVFGFLALRFQLPSIVGYLLAGLLIGPYTPGYIANHEIAQQLAEIGVILLMFGVGLHFHLKDLLAVRRVALTGAFCEITIVASIGIARRTQLWLPVARSHPLRHQPLGREHRSSDPRSRRQPRSAESSRPHCRRLADRGGHLHSVCSRRSTHRPWRSRRRQLARRAVMGRRKTGGFDWR